MSSIDRYSGPARLPARVERQTNREISVAISRAAVQRVRDELELGRIRAAGHTQIGNMIGFGAHAAAGVQAHPFLEAHLHGTLMDLNQAMSRVVERGA